MNELCSNVNQPGNAHTFSIKNLTKFRATKFTKLPKSFALIFGLVAVINFNSLRNTKNKSQVLTLALVWRVVSGIYAQSE